jgi:hypothetical protein
LSWQIFPGSNTSLYIKCAHTSCVAYAPSLRNRNLDMDSMSDKNSWFLRSRIDVCFCLVLCAAESLVSLRSGTGVNALSLSLKRNYSDSSHWQVRAWEFKFWVFGIGGDVSLLRRSCTLRER